MYTSRKNVGTNRKNVGTKRQNVGTGKLKRLLKNRRNGLRSTVGLTHLRIVLSRFDTAFVLLILR